MKIKTTTTVMEIECSADDLRQSNSLAESFSNTLRRAFCGPIYNTGSQEESEDEENE